MEKTYRRPSQTFCSILLWIMALSFSGAAYNVEAVPYIYPSKGQSQDQQSKDKGACREWAVQQSGVDPAILASQSSSGEVYQRHHSALGGATRGALLGVVGGAIAGDAGKGAAIGAGVGAVGGIMRGRRDLATQHVVYENAHTEQQAQLQSYDRAYAACLTGRGYTVK